MVLSTLNGICAEFEILYPNQADVSMNPGSNYGFVWSSTLPENTPIEILLSFDSGKTFFVRLSSSTNDGFEVVKIPSNFSSTDSCKVMVRSLLDSAQSSISEHPFTISSYHWSLLIDKTDSVIVSIENTWAELGLST